MAKTAEERAERVERPKNPVKEGVPIGPTPEETEDAAKRGYLAFAAAMGYKDLHGEDLPTWEQLAVVVQQAWDNAAFAIMTGDTPVGGS